MYRYYSSTVLDSFFRGRFCRLGWVEHDGRRGIEPFLSADGYIHVTSCSADTSRKFRGRSQRRFLSYNASRSFEWPCPFGELSIIGAQPVGRQFSICALHALSQFSNIIKIWRMFTVIAVSDLESGIDAVEAFALELIDCHIIFHI
jgi:hypothetical protein